MDLAKAYNQNNQPNHGIRIFERLIKEQDNHSSDNYFAYAIYLSSLDLYKKGKITLGRAGEIAGLSLWEMIDIVREKRIPMPYTIEDVEKDIKIAKEVSKRIK